MPCDQALGARGEQLCRSYCGTWWR